MQKIIIVFWIFITMLTPYISPGLTGEQGCAEMDISVERAPEDVVDRAPGEAIELIWIMGDPGFVPTAQNMVEAYLNEISSVKIGVNMKTIYLNNDATRLYLAAGEEWDIAFTCEWFNNFLLQGYNGYFSDITEKIQRVTPKLYATMPEIVWEGAKIDGKIMAVPVKKDYAAELYYRFNKELFADSLGMPIPAEMDFYDIEPFLATGKKAIADHNPAVKAEYPLMLTKEGFGGLSGYFDAIIPGAR